MAYTSTNTNMTASTGLTPGMQTYYNRELLRTFEPELVHMQFGEEEVVVLDEERKAAMVSNLLVVLCGSKDAQPIVNSGSLY